MSNRKATPDVLGEILNGTAAAKLPTVAQPKPAVEAKAQAGTRQTAAKTSTKTSTKTPVKTTKTPAKAKAQAPAWDYLELTLHDFRGWRPRCIDGRDVDDWKDGPIFRTYLQHLGSQGWELVGIVEAGRNERDAYFKRLKTP